MREVWGDSDADVDTPRGGITFPDVGRERDKEFSESLRCVVCLLRCPSLTLTAYVVQEPGPGIGERRADEHGRVGARPGTRGAFTHRGRTRGQGAYGLASGLGMSFPYISACVLRD